MTHEQFYASASEITNYADRDAYISDLALSSIWGEESDLSEIADQLGTLWDVWNMSVKELRAVTGLSQAAFGHRFLIPIRTVVNWETSGSNHRDCPPYTRMMIADLLGLLPERTED